MSITVFTGASCAPCHQLKTYLKRIGATFIEKPIEEGDNRSEALSLTGYSIVPVTVIEKGEDKSVVVGYNLAGIVKALRG